MRAFRAGANGYLTKASAGAELIRAVERILEKMKMHTNAELTHYAISNKLVE